MQRLADHAWCLDIDGTLVRFEEPIEGASLFLHFMSQHSIPFVILSNTGQKRAIDVRARLRELLSVDIPERRIFTACDRMRTRVCAEAARFTRILVYPTEYASDLAHATALDPSAVEPHAVPEGTRWCVCLFFDGFLAEYYEVLAAVINLVSMGAELWVTSRDDFLVRGTPERPWLKPGPGAFVASILTMIPHATIHSFGKEERDFDIGNVVAELQTQGFRGRVDDIVVIGDKYDTDVRFGVNNGVKTMLVESGCDRARSLHTLQPRVDIVVDSIADIPRETAFSLGPKKSRRAVLLDFLKHTAQRTLLSLSPGLPMLSNMLHRASDLLHPPPRRIKSVPARLNELAHK